MGLDMSIYKGKEEVAYWRKEHDLHQLFNDLADKQGIQYESFNCIEVPLQMTDIDYIIGRLHEIELRDVQATKEILAHCKFLAGTGAELYYDSWW